MATAKDETKDREDTSATRKGSEKRSKYVVKPGNTLTRGVTDSDGNATQKVFNPGDEVELTAEEAARMPWVVGEKPKGSDRERSGQTIRLRRQVAALEAEVARLKADAETVAKVKESPEYKQAIESLLSRGDNFIGRGEPEAGKVPPEVLDNFEMRTADDDGPLSDKVGMKGLERGGDDGGKTGTVQTPGASPSVPSSPKGGESVRPGDSKPSSGDKS